jgi:putative ABC transport system substrate-binding protein
VNRRSFITLLGGGAAAWPLGASAQTDKLVRLGYLDGGARGDPTTQNLRRQFVLGMPDLGYSDITRAATTCWRSVTLPGS